MGLEYSAQLRASAQLAWLEVAQLRAENERLKSELAEAKKDARIEFLRQQLASALAAIEAKDASLMHYAEEDERNAKHYPPEFAKAALAIKPDASILKAHDEALIERCAEVVIGIANKDAGNPYKQALRIGAEAIRELKETL